VQPIINLPDTILLRFHERNLAVYPHCANLNELDMKSCCDKDVLSAAGREFCYNENRIYNPKEYDKCKNTDVVEVFKCCETLEVGNKYYAYQCQSELTKSDCTTNEACATNYKTGLEKYLRNKMDLEALPLEV